MADTGWRDVAAGFDALLLDAPPAAAPDRPYLLEAELDLFALDDPLVINHPEAFELRRHWPGDEPVDPRRPMPAAGEARARLASPAAASLVFPAIAARLLQRIEAGAAGFRIHRPHGADPRLLEGLCAHLRERRPDVRLIAHLPGVPRSEARRLRGFDGLVTSFAHWDQRAPWFAEEYEDLRRIGPLLAEVDQAAADRVGSGLAVARTVRLAGLLGDGLILSSSLVERAGAAVEEALCASDGGKWREMRLVSAGRHVTAILQGDADDFREARSGRLILVNRSDSKAALPHEADVRTAAGAEFEPFEAPGSEGPAFAPLEPGEVRVLQARRAAPIRRKKAAGPAKAKEAARQPRLVIEKVSPDVDNGRFAVKRVVGDTVEVDAIFFGDGHEQLAAELRWRAVDEQVWNRVRMAEKGNDLWTASFPVERMGRYEYVVEGWLDRFGGYRRDLVKKIDAGVALPVDFLEGRALIEAAARRERRLEDFLGDFDVAPDDAVRGQVLLDPELQLLMDEADDRPFALASAPRRIEADRLAARFSSWYELFPRSQSGDPARHGTFRDVIARLPQIREMGFDTLYFPPIHPIGRKHRKGRNNSLTPGPDDPGSPYAIGSAEGGHDALHPELGTFEDFRALVAAARREGLEIALDFAIQCSPDHPWLSEHPGWFDWRPDGTIKYAENPPKKYQDIVNVDFWRDESIPDLWIALRDVILFWVDQGVKTFRVDNPHTKPFPFWEWMIDDVRAGHPDVIFLSEAFTRPAVMYRLAKLGFTQSYTYFTWRTGKKELTDYLVELTTTEAAEFMRPHFFVNTPDINPTYLHRAGPAAFKVRAVLGATLSGLFGVYSGFELCESEPVPGKEEYWESEKYEIKPRDWQAPGNIIADISRLNRLRRAYPALQTHLNVSFYNAGNDQILYYGKPAPDGSEMILVAVNLDPTAVHECDFEIPLWEFGLPDHGSFDVEDLVTGARFSWHGKIQHLRLDPDQPYALWRVAPQEQPDA